jgi:hypothetical protein
MLWVTDPITKEVMKEAKDNISKTALFYSLFFPPHPAEDTTPRGVVYPRPKWDYKPVTNEQIA